MSQTFQRVTELVGRRDVYVSEHGYDELSNDQIAVGEVIKGVKEAQIVEDYPTYHKGPAVLVLQHDSRGRPIHVVWGIATNTDSPAVLVTAYRPDPDHWSEDFLRRKQ